MGISGFGSEARIINASFFDIAAGSRKESGFWTSFDNICASLVGKRSSYVTGVRGGGGCYTGTDN